MSTWLAYWTRIASFSFADFRVNERAFQLMEQVSGRAGRSWMGKGRVLIQVADTAHPVLGYIKTHDYSSFSSSTNFPFASNSVIHHITRIIQRHVSPYRTRKSSRMRPTAFLPSR
jgi:hypothetical protein